MDISHADILRVDIFHVEIPSIDNLHVDISHAYYSFNKNLNVFLW